MRRVFIFFTMLCVAVMLAACTPTNDGRRTTEDGGRTTKDEGRTTNVLTTVTLVPTLTATPLPTATVTTTPTPTLTPTPTRTPSPAEVRAARLPALGGWAWRADGDSVKLYDAKGAAVATLDQKTGGLRWDSQKHFDDLNNFIKADAKLDDRAAIASWMKALKDQGIQFITFPDTRENFPPYLLTLSPDGKDVKMIAAKKGTADFVYDAKAEKILGVFPDASDYYYLNPDGSFDLAPLQQQAETIANDLLKRGVIQHPIPAKVEIIRDAIIKAIMINPYGATPAEINEFIKSRTGKDFAKHFDETWGNKVGVTYEQVMEATLAKSPKDVFGHVSSIKPSNSQWTTWTTVGLSSGIIKIRDADITDKEIDPLDFIVLKETYGSATYLNAYRQAKDRQPFYENNNEIGGRIGGALSLAIKAYTQQLQHRPDGEINISIDYAFQGGIIL